MDFNFHMGKFDIKIEKEAQQAFVSSCVVRHFVESFNRKKNSNGLEID